MVWNSPKHRRLVSKTAGLVFYSGCIKYVQIPVHVPSLSGFVTLGGRGPEDSCVMFYWERWMEWVPGLPSDSRIRKRRCVSSGCSTGRKGSWSHMSSVLFPAGSLAPRGEQVRLPVELAWLPSLERFFGVCPLTNWLPGLMVISVMGATFPSELGGEGKTHHINNLMHPW